MAAAATAPARTGEPTTQPQHPPLFRIRCIPPGPRETPAPRSLDEDVTPNGARTGTRSVFMDFRAFDYTVTFLLFSSGYAILSSKPGRLAI